ncbi:MAG: FimB/Mfa2 family fimbrial subunit [Rikenellaceae bacterium]
MKNITPLILTAIIFCSSCIKEDTSDCPSLTSISHHFVLNSSGENLIDSEVDSLKIFIFDSLDILSLYEEVLQPTSASKTYVRLSPQRYTIVTIAGDHSTYKLYDNSTLLSPQVGSTTLENLKVKILEEESASTAQRPSNLFMSSPMTFEAYALKENHVDVPLIQMTKTIKLRIIGATTHTTQIEIDHSTLNYDATADTTDNHALYIEEGLVIGDTVEYDYKVLRLFIDDETARINLDFTAAQSQSQPFGYFRTSSDSDSIDLMSTISDSPDYSTQDDLDKESQFDIDVDYSQGVGITVSINGWTVKNIWPL